MPLLSGLDRFHPVTFWAGCRPPAPRAVDALLFGHTPDSDRNSAEVHGCIEISRQKGLVVSAFGPRAIFPGRGMSGVIAPQAITPNPPAFGDRGNQIAFRTPQLISHRHKNRVVRSPRKSVPRCISAAGLLG